MFTDKNSDEENPYVVLGFADPDSEIVDRPGLGVLSKNPKKADEQIRSAYRAMMRESHPDKNPGDIESNTTSTTQELNAAYEKIKDEKARRQFSAGKKRNLQIQKRARDLAKPTLGTFLFIVLLIALLTSMPLLVALRLDGTIDASWPVVFVPFWIVDFMWLWILAYVSSSTYASVGMNSCMTLFTFFLIFASIVGFQVMICMDEDDPFIKDNYLVAIVPIILASCSLCVAFTSCCLENSASVLTVASFLWYDSAGVWVRAVIWSQCVIAQSVLIALKLNGVSEYKSREWTYIFIPSYVMLGLFCMLFMTSGALTVLECRENIVLESIRIAESKASKTPYDVDKILESTPFLRQKKKKAMKYTQEQFEARKARTVGRCFCGFLEFCCLLVCIPIFTTVIYSLQSEEDGHDKIDSVFIILPILIVLGLLCLCCTWIHLLEFVRRVKS
eukprot:g4346.t1